MNTDNTQHGAEPALASAGSTANPLEQIIRGTVRLHELIEQGRCDSEKADAVRDAMDAPFLELSKSEQEAVRMMSAAIKDRQPQPTLTDEEREAIEACVDWCDGVASPTQSERADTLRGLLERLGGGE